MATSAPATHPASRLMPAGDGPDSAAHADQSQPRHAAQLDGLLQEQHQQQQQQPPQFTKGNDSPKPSLAALADQSGHTQQPPASLPPSASTPFAAIMLSANSGSDDDGMFGRPSLVGKTMAEPDSDDDVLSPRLTKSMNAAAIRSHYTASHLPAGQSAAESAHAAGLSDQAASLSGQNSAIAKRSPWNASASALKGFLSPPSIRGLDGSGSGRSSRSSSRSGSFSASASASGRASEAGGVSAASMGPGESRPDHASSLSPQSSPLDVSPGSGAQGRSSIVNRLSNILGKTAMGRRMSTGASGAGTPVLTETSGVMIAEEGPDGSSGNPRLSDASAPSPHRRSTLFGTNMPSGDQPTSNSSTPDGTGMSRGARNSIVDSSPSRRSSVQRRRSSIFGKLASVELGYDEQDGRPDPDVDDLHMRLILAERDDVSGSFCLDAREVAFLCRKAKEKVMQQPVLLHLPAPIMIVGDLHGQYDDLLRILAMCGKPYKTRYLFLGDYVDRGPRSLETMLLLMCYKIQHTDTFFLLRGNHECAEINKTHGFFEECRKRMSVRIWREFVDFFDCLPIAAIVQEKIFCIHAGLSPSLNTLDDIAGLQRPLQIPESGLVTDLLWSDPGDNDEITWQDSNRGISYNFNMSVLETFMRDNQFDVFVRSHSVVYEGYQFWGNHQLVTIFSATNYCDMYNNSGAVLEVEDDLTCSFSVIKPTRLTPNPMPINKRVPSPPPESRTSLQHPSQ
ncbi:Metallo-dependent phosphatase-like protein [Entophlyctis helioformis]|nr:Metallo-dependent phosphatase-like protein [Entophlyctis helioformis]